MRILVTGRKGQIARSLAERAGDHQVICIGRPELELKDELSIHRTIERSCADLVISAAAYTAVDAAELEPDLAMLINGRAPGTIGRAAADIGVPVIHLSTDYVFDGKLDRAAREGDTEAPLSVYGCTKLAGERALADSGARFAVVRTAWVYSPFGRNFVNTMLRLASDRDRLNIVDDQIGSPTSALDIADALLTMAALWRESANNSINTTYHFAARGQMTWAAFARAVFAESLRRGGPSAEVWSIPTSDYPTPALRPANSTLDPGLFERTFMYSAPPWEQSLAEVVGRLVRDG